MCQHMVVVNKLQKCVTFQFWRVLCKSEWRSECSLSGLSVVMGKNHDSGLHILIDCWQLFLCMLSELKLRPTLSLTRSPQPNHQTNGKEVAKTQPALRWQPPYLKLERSISSIKPLKHFINSLQISKPCCKSLSG